MCVCSVINETTHSHTLFCTCVVPTCVLIVNKQINDKERVAAAMENPGLKGIVEECVVDRDT